MTEWRIPSKQMNLVLKCSVSALNHISVNHTFYNVLYGNRKSFKITKYAMIRVLERQNVKVIVTLMFDIWKIVGFKIQLWTA